MNIIILNSEVMMDRKLVTIRTISEIQPIEGADAIEKVRIDGWWCVSKKDQFKVGDRCLYYEIDSFLPILPEYSFMESRGRKKMIHDGKEIEGYRLRTIKLRGQISQGLALPLHLFSGIDLYAYADMSEALGVILYERPIPAQLAGMIKGDFPVFIPKTDEERVQNLVLDFTGDLVMTEKLDGTSATYYKREGVFGVCSRNLELKDTESNTHWRMARKYKLSDMPDGFAIQGEIVGPGIQGNPLLLQEVGLYVFKVYDINKGEQMSIEEVCMFCGRHNLQTVPVLDIFKATNNVEDYLSMANGCSKLNPNKPREGIVFRNGKYSFKAISNIYLLGEK